MYIHTSSVVFLQLDQPFVASDAVRTVEFLRAGGTNPGIGAEVDTAGWGANDHLGSRPDKLQELTVDVFSPKRCARSDYYGSKFTSNMMCAHRLCPEPCHRDVKKDDTCDVSVCLHEAQTGLSRFRSGSGSGSGLRSGTQKTCSASSHEHRQCENLS